MSLSRQPQADSRKPRPLVSRSERETMRIAARFAATLRGGEVILLDGDLGAGKTVFVRGLARGLGIRGRITSPTFVVMRAHEVDSRQSTVVRKRGSRQRLSTNDVRPSTLRWLVHVDAYRVRDARDLVGIGLFEWIGRPDTIVAIEWGERVAGALRRFRCMHITMQSTSNDVHRIVIRRP